MLRIKPLYILCGEVQLPSLSIFRNGYAMLTDAMSTLPSPLSTVSYLITSHLFSTCQTSHSNCFADTNVTRSLILIFVRTGLLPYVRQLRNMSREQLFISAMETREKQLVAQVRATVLCLRCVLLTHPYVCTCLVAC